MNSQFVGTGYVSTNAAAFTVAQFCASHGGMSRTLFYELVKQGRGPKTFKVGRRTLISTRAADDWVKRMEDESNPSNYAAWIDINNIVRES